MKSENINLNYYAVVLLLRHLVKEGKCTKDLAQRIAARVAKNLGADAIISI